MRTPPNAIDPSLNVTGVTNFMNVLGAKRLKLAGEVVPKAEAFALLVNRNNPNAESDTTDLRAAADALESRQQSYQLSNSFFPYTY